MLARDLIAALRMLGDNAEVAISVNGTLCKVGAIDWEGDVITLEAAKARPHELMVRLGQIREMATTGQAAGIVGGAARWRDALEAIERSASRPQ